MPDALDQLQESVNIAEQYPLRLDGDVADRQPVADIATRLPDREIAASHKLTQDINDCQAIIGKAAVVLKLKNQITRLTTSP